MIQKNELDTTTHKATLLTQSHTFRQQSKQLLDTAKHAVKIAIKKGWSVENVKRYLCESMHRCYF